MRCQVIFDFVKRENGGMPFDPMIVALPGVTVEVYTQVRVCRVGYTHRSILTLPETLT